MANHTLRSDSRSENTGPTKKKRKKARKKRKPPRNSFQAYKKKVTPKQRRLTGSLVFDEEQLEALLERVLVHVELHLHPEEEEEEEGWTERWTETERQVEMRRVQEGNKIKRTRGGAAGE